MIEAIIITALLSNGLQIATQDGMILHFVKVWLDKVFITQKVTLQQPQVSKLYYPILYCIKCMPSIYGTIICLLMLPITIDLVWQIPVVVISAVCLSTIISTQYI